MTDLLTMMKPRTWPSESSGKSKPVRTEAWVQLQLTNSESGCDTYPLKMEEASLEWVAYHYARAGSGRIESALETLQLRVSEQDVDREADRRLLQALVESVRSLEQKVAQLGSVSTHPGRSAAEIRAGLEALAGPLVTDDAVSDGPPLTEDEVARFFESDD